MDLASLFFQAHSPPGTFLAIDSNNKNLAFGKAGQNWRVLPSVQPRDAETQTIVSTEAPSVHLHNFQKSVATHGFPTDFESNSARDLDAEIMKIVKQLTDQQLLKSPEVSRTALFIQTYFVWQGASAFVEPLRLPNNRMTSDERKVQRPDTPLLDVVMHLATMPSGSALDKEWTRLMTSEEQEQQRRSADAQRASVAALKASELAATSHLVSVPPSTRPVGAQSFVAEPTFLPKSEQQAAAVAEQVVGTIRKEFLQPQAEQLAKITELERSHSLELDQLKQRQSDLDRKVQQAVEERFFAACSVFFFN